MLSRVPRHQSTIQKFLRLVFTNPESCCKTKLDFNSFEQKAHPEHRTHSSNSNSSNKTQASASRATSINQAMVYGVVKTFQAALKYRGGWRGLIEHMYTVSGSLRAGQFCFGMCSKSASSQQHSTDGWIVYRLKLIHPFFPFYLLFRMEIIRLNLVLLWEVMLQGIDTMKIVSIILLECTDG
jgi:hypothetical protein